jgi:hypothetical protein
MKVCDVFRPIDQTPYAFMTKIFFPIRLFFILKSLCWISFIFIISGTSIYGFPIAGNLSIIGDFPKLYLFLTGGKYAH